MKYLPGLAFEKWLSGAASKSHGCCSNESQKHGGPWRCVEALKPVRNVLFLPENETEAIIWHGCKQLRQFVIHMSWTKLRGVQPISLLVTLQ